MPLPRRILIRPDLAVPLSELRFSTSRSGGPGGQHVNKTESRVTLYFDVAGSASLTDAQRRRLRARLPTRITRAGTLILHCQQHRSQAANRAELLLRFEALVREALRVRRKRRPTRPGTQARERRLRQKKRRGALKRDRRSGQDDEA